MNRSIPSEIALRSMAPSLGVSKGASDKAAASPTPIIAPPISQQPLADLPTRTWREFCISRTSDLISVSVHTALLVSLALLFVDTKAIEPQSIFLGISDTSNELSDLVLEAEPSDQLQLASDESTEAVTPEVPSLRFGLEQDLELPRSSEVSSLAAAFGNPKDLEYRKSVGLSGLALGSEFGDMVEYANQNGLELVIVFDSTGSMGNEIAGVKKQIVQIGSALLRQLPSARIGLVTYRDQNPQDGFAVRGLPLTNDLNELTEFLKPIFGVGGGDTEESVELGLKWAITENTFRPKARKIILIFGDAPPHIADLPICTKLASDFRRNKSGLVTTVTVRALQPLNEFYMIAKAGGGEAYTNNNAARLMSDLLVLTFGAKHREDVAKFFEITEAFKGPEKATTKTPNPSRRSSRDRR